MLRALVIDDSAYNRVTISRMLESSPQIKVVATAVNGEDGIKQVVKHRPDVITLDLEMPVMDGFAFLRWLMANKPTPVIAVSSRSSDRSVFKALDLGAIDFIAKPVRPDALWSARDLKPRPRPDFGRGLDQAARRVGLCVRVAPVHVLALPCRQLVRHLGLQRFDLLVEFVEFLRQRLQALDGDLKHSSGCTCRAAN